MLKREVVTVVSTAAKIYDDPLNGAYIFDDSTQYLKKEGRLITGDLVENYPADLPFRLNLPLLAR